MKKFVVALALCNMCAALVSAQATLWPLYLQQNVPTTSLALWRVSNDAFVFQPAPVVSTDSGGRNYQIVIPFNNTVTLVFASAFFKLTNASGQYLAQTATTLTPVSVPLGQQPTTVGFNVVGAGK